MLALYARVGHSDTMSENSKLCPVCFSQNASAVDEGVTSAITCQKCGRYGISFEAEELLLNSDAPAPSPYGASNAFRWAMRGEDSVFVSLNLAQRLLQRRTHTWRASPRYRDVLTWLRRGKGEASLSLDGWAAVINELSPEAALARIRRLERRGLVTFRHSGDEYSLEISACGNAIMDRREKRNSRTRRLNRMRSKYTQTASTNRFFYLSSISLARYKCFGDNQKVSFVGEDGLVSRWTFLIGENGVGKTAVLQAIAGLTPERSWRETGWKSSIHEWEDVKSLSNAQSPDSLRIEAEFHQGELGTRPENLSIFGAAGNAILDTIENMEGLRLAGDTASIAYSTVLTYSANTGYLPSSPLVVGYGASRAVAKYGLTADQDRGPATDTLFNPETPLQNPEGWLLQNDYTSRFLEAGQSANNGEKLKAALLKILPDVEDIAILAPDDRHDRPWVGFSTKQGRIDYRSLSIGYQSTIAWVVDLAIRMIENYPDEDDPLTMPAVVLIDEIDNHLHPRWQRSITRHLEEIFPAAQFIATTHSPLIIQGSVKANLALLRSKGGAIEVINDVDEIRKFRVDQILTSELFGLKSARPDREANLFQRKTNILSGTEPETYDGELDEIERLLQDSGASEKAPLTTKALDLVKRLKSSH